MKLKNKQKRWRKNRKTWRKNSEKETTKNEIRVYCAIKNANH